MIQSFRDEETEAIYHGENTKKVRRRLPNGLHKTAVRKLDHLNSASELKDLGAPPGNKLEALEGDRKGQHSIRINVQYRICFAWTDAGPKDVEIVDYH